MISLSERKAWGKDGKMEVKVLCGRGRQYIFTVVSCGKKKVTDRREGKRR